MSLIPSPPAHIQKEIEELDRIVDPVLAAQGLRQAVGDEYPRGRTVSLTIASVHYSVRAVPLAECAPAHDPDLVLLGRFRA